MVTKNNKVKWSKTTSLKELNKTIKFLSNLVKEHESSKKETLTSEYMIEFEMKTMIAYDYLISRQFIHLMPNLYDDYMFSVFNELYDEDNIKDAIIKNEKSKDITKTNIFGLYVDNNGLPIKDATCPEYFKNWEKLYYSDFYSNLTNLMENISWIYLDGKEVFSYGNKEITKYSTKLKNRYVNNCSNKATNKIKNNNICMK